MSDRYQGGIIRATPLEPSSSSASGIWTMEQQAKAEAAGNWPAPPILPLQIDRSLRFNSADSAYLNRTPASAGDLKTWTWSGWVKLSNPTAAYTMPLFGVATTSSNFTMLHIYNNAIRLQEYSTIWRETTALYRDASAWYHIVCALDTTQATAGDRVKIYVNGVQVTSFATTNNPTQNQNLRINLDSEHRIGSVQTDSAYAGGYMAEINFIDGQALTPTDFGQYGAITGVWEPIAYTGTYGTNGFHLDFSDNTSTTTIGYDTSGNGNNWTANNFSVTAGAGNDSLLDTPTSYGTDTGAGGEVGGNYCTLNTVFNSLVTGQQAKNGGLDIARVSGLGWQITPGTFGMQSGKWYFEATMNQTDNFMMAGVMPVNTTPNNSYTTTYIGDYGWAYQSDGRYWNRGTEYTSKPVCNLNDVMCFAVDMDNGKIWFGKNGTWDNSGNPAAGTNAIFTDLLTYASAGVWVGASVYSSSSGITFNFGQRAFAHTAPSGFKALCTQNLPTPDVVQGTTAFNTVLYTSTGTTQPISGVGFQPDFVWMKSRSAARYHWLADVVRGTGKILFSQAQDAEGTYPDVLSSFDSDGFTTNSNNNVGDAMVAWNWKAGGSGVSNTDGSITSTVSANTTAGISIVTWTANGSANQTIGHGLGVTPSLIIVKDRDQGSGYDWNSWFTGYTADQYISLNTTDARGTYSSIWGNTPGSSYFWVGSTGTAVNTSGDRYVAYVFAEVPGFSRISSYLGNGSSDGTYVYTGFRPAFVLLKCQTTSGTNWFIADSARSPYNAVDLSLFPNLTSVEYTYTFYDFLSNGFKIRNTGSGLNDSGTRYNYIAFAENPFKYALAR